MWFAPTAIPPPQQPPEERVMNLSSTFAPSRSARPIVLVLGFVQ